MWIWYKMPVVSGAKLVPSTYIHLLHRCHTPYNSVLDHQIPQQGRIWTVHTAPARRRPSLASKELMLLHAAYASQAKDLVQSSLSLAFNTGTQPAPKH